MRRKGSLQFPAHLAQKQQDGECELQPPSVPEDFTYEPKTPSETYGEQYQSAQNAQNDQSTRRERTFAGVR